MDLVRQSIAGHQTSPLLRIVAQPIFPASLYQLERLRCNLCGQVASDSVSPTAKEDIARYLCNWLGDGNIREVLVCFRSFDCNCGHGRRNI